MRDVVEKGKVSNDMYRFFERAAQNPGSGWKVVESARVQELADAGRFVVGVKANPSGMGHVAVAVPSVMQKHADPAAQGGFGPWIRDAQHASGSVRASKAGNTHQWGQRGVLWVVWEHPDANTLQLQPTKPSISVEQKALTLPPPPGKLGFVASASKEEAALTALRGLENRGRNVPPPPPGGGGGGAPLGGVDLGMTAKVSGEGFPRLAGLVLDPSRQSVVLLTDSTGYQTGLSTRDIAVALWLVYGSSSTSVQFSLDPADPRDPHGNWLKAVYLPELLRGRGFGASMFEADFLLKQYAMGVELDDQGAKHERRSTVQGFETFVQLMMKDATPRDGSQWGRYWIVVDSVRIGRSAGSIVFESVKMRVEARRQELDPTSPTGLRDVATGANSLETRWAKLFCEHYDRIAQEAPEFERLRELAKALAIAKFLKSENVAIDMNWVTREVNADKVRPVDRVSALSARWTKETRVPFSDATGQGERVTTTSVSLFGGVDLTVNATVKSGDPVARAIEKNVNSTLSQKTPPAAFEVARGVADARAFVLPITTHGQTLWREATRN